MEDFPGFGLLSSDLGSCSTGVALLLGTLIALLIGYWSIKSRFDTSVSVSSAGKRLPPASNLADLGAHRDEAIFEEPDKFDPSRFDTSSKSKTFPPYTYIPFGAGPRICPGVEFGRIEALLIIHHMVSNYRWSELIPDEPITHFPLPCPAMGLPVKLHPTKIIV